MGAPPANDLPLSDGFAATSGRFLWHEPTHTAVLADLHLGIETTLTNQGLYMPHVNVRRMRDAWRQVVSRNPRHLILAGDLFDSPAPDPATVDSCRELLRELPASCRITLTPGNHDPEPGQLVSLLEGLNVTIQPAVNLAGHTITHGHEIPADFPPTTKGLIVGHQHPAVVLSTRVQSAKMPCYAVCKLRDSDVFAPSAPTTPRPSRGNRAFSLIILSAFSPLSLGSNLLTSSHWLLPLPRPSNSQIRIIGLLDSKPTPRVLDFGPLDGL